MIWSWNSETNSVECTYKCRGHSQCVACISVNPAKNRFATGSWDNTLKIWKTGTIAFNFLTVTVTVGCNFTVTLYLSAYKKYFLDTYSTLNCMSKSHSLVKVFKNIKMN